MKLSVPPAFILGTFSDDLLFFLTLEKVSVQLELPLSPTLSTCEIPKWAWSIEMFLLLLNTSLSTLVVLQQMRPVLRV